MTKRKPISAIIGTAAVLAASFALGGCQSNSQIMANEEKIAIDTAVRRGQFELNCPTATGEELTSDMLQPVLWRGIERAEYTIGVSGCGKRSTYTVICPLDSSDCVSTSGQDMTSDN